MNNEYFLFIWLDFSNWFSHIFVHLGSLWMGAATAPSGNSGCNYYNSGVPARRDTVTGRISRLGLAQSAKFVL